MNKRTVELLSEIEKEKNKILESRKELQKEHDLMLAFIEETENKIKRL